MSSANCESCREEIEPDAKKCPHCGEKRMTKERYLLNLLVYVPIISFIAGSVLYAMFASSSPEVTINWLFGLILVCYAGGAYIARSKREAVREGFREQESSG